MKHTSRSVVALLAMVTLGSGLLVGCPSDDEADTPSTTAASSAADDSSTKGVADVCGPVTVEDVGALVGATVTMESQPGGGCSFDQEDPQAVSIAFNTSNVGDDDTDGTFNQARVGAFGVLTDPTKEEPGLGDYSVVASGSVFGGESQQGVGLVQVGRTLVQVTVAQASGIDGAVVRDLTTKALSLAASKL